MVAFLIYIVPFCGGVGKTVSCENAVINNPPNTIEKNIFLIVNILLVIEIVNINSEQTMTMTMITAGMNDLIAWRGWNYRRTASFFTIHFSNEASPFIIDPFLHLSIFCPVKINCSINDGI